MSMTYSILKVRSVSFAYFFMFNKVLIRRQNSFKDRHISIYLNEKPSRDGSNLKSNFFMGWEILMRRQNSFKDQYIGNHFNIWGYLQCLSNNFLHI